MLRDASFDEGLHCLPKYPLRGFWYAKGELNLDWSLMQKVTYTKSSNLFSYGYIIRTKSLLDDGAWFKIPHYVMSRGALAVPYQYH